MVTIAIYASLQTALLVLWCRQNSTNTAIAEPVLGLIESFALAALSFVEHRNSKKPSKLIGTFLVVDIILDIALVRTFWIRSMRTIAAVFTASFVIKTILLILEETPKSLLDEKEKIHETSSGVVNRSFFWWLNGLFLQGHRTILETEDLQAIDSKFDTDHVSAPLEKQWERARNSGQPSLLKSTFLAYKWQVAAGIIPRLLHSGFNFAQPFLIQSVIVLVSKKEMSVQISSGLIGATVLIYLGLAISGAWHKHMSYQLVTMYRGGLVSLIFKKTLKLKTTSIKDSAPVTLMTADVETIVAAGASVHDMWANMLELPVGIYLLYRQVVTTILSGIISPAMEPATVRWNEAVQKRVGETSSMLNQMKGIKMMGLTDFFRKMVQGLRVKELKVSAKFRWLLVYFTALAMISAQLTPVVVIMSAIYWTKADGGLSVAEAFTSLSLISLVTQPLVMILVSLMQIAGVVGGCGRIQAFLLSDEQVVAKETVDVDAVTMQNANFQAPDGNSLLTDINLRISPGTLNMLAGRVGCGKSSLLRAIIGELIPAEGTVKTEDSLAYCDQVPWLRNTTIRENIVGLSPMDDKWLSTVLHACALEEDLHQLPQGQETTVGSGGVALSGGQKQRVALSRAVYSRKKLIILDDVFSSLDRTTADAVFHRLLGADGLLRTSTVVLVTSNVFTDPSSFSQDMTLIDMSLPLAFYLTLDLTLRCLVQIGVVASGASYFGAFLPISFLALYLIQKYYLRTSRQMRLLDLEAKTPLYTQFTEITAGLATIRSFGWTDEFLDESCLLDLFVAGMAILLVTIALRIPGTTSEGAIGLAMVNLLGLNLTLTTVIDQWTTLETSLGAIARLKSFISNTPNENKQDETKVPDNWPGGRIVFDGVTASYSGKSSLILSILRLLELQSGRIHIDGKDLASLSRQHIRSQITTIPQDPVSLSGTVRQNLDPEALIQADEILIEALRKTTLWATIDTRGGLDADLSELGFSVGQRQLFCLARAFLSHSKIVLLDEPTSSVDNATDKDVRRIIREVMQGRTVIEVTHRLDYVTDFDLAVVMKDGRIIETGDPKELLVQNSALKALRG
ncbi:hypothetical protein HZS61_014582 [Fusarium oxysporum f. sp. conglutinans]|uniref:Uncharacterized protein n=1 Tax=Fusarium oxysporum f. sp. conglutinans TaxID=100902 RepID=A0A8H6LK38_FUSOX|nr:hypothetical protein HZS61_014582 [Fusarium oxysporum f. sp. conglutinans]